MIPEKRLYLAVLKRGLQDLYIKTALNNESIVNLRKEATEWFEDTESYHEFSIRRVCEVLKVDIRYILEKLSIPHDL